MQIEINFILTEEARIEAEKFPDMGSWRSPDLAATPLQGDLISFGGDESPNFEVRNRMFIWRSPTHLVIQPLLGLWAPAADQSTSG